MIQTNTGPAPKHSRFSGIKRPVAIGFCLLPLLSCTTMPERNISDHCDGKTFYNPTLAKQFSPGMTDLFRMLQEARAAWPEKVQNLGVAHLPEKLERDDIGLTFVNHATFLIQFSNLNILTDPIWSERANPMNWIGPKRVRDLGVRLEDLPKIDWIIISSRRSY